MPSVLFVYSSSDKTMTGKPTGWYLPEAAHPYYIVTPHADIDFASPKGPNPPLDEASKKAFAEDAGSVKFLHDQTVKNKLATAQKVADVDMSKYDAVFYIGGHAPAINFSRNPINAELVSKFWQSGKIVSAVCHGPAALVGGVDASGKSLFTGKKVTGLSNAEETTLGATKEVPFLLETKLVELGGKCEKAEDLFAPHVVVDGKLITGQNPASSAGVGEALVKALQV